MKKIKLNPSWVGRAAYLFTAFLRQTLSIRVEAHAQYDPKQPALFAFWHGQQLLPVLELHRHQTPRAALVSPSRDGDILTRWLTLLGYEVIRGSSRDQNIRCLVEIIRKIKSGSSVGFGIDGPVGPIYQVKPGMTYMAQKCQCPIIAVGSQYSKKWVATKAWDQYQIPKPFAKAAFYLSEPMWVPENADLDACNLELETRLHLANQKALTLL